MLKAYYIVLLIGVILYLVSTCLTEANEDKLWNNNIRFTGVIKEINKSRNHGFSIFFIELDWLNSNSGTNTCNKLPYRVKGGHAEIYAICGMDDYTGCHCKLNSNDKQLLIRTSSKIIDTLNIDLVRDEADIDFIRLNSKLGI